MKQLRVHHTVIVNFRRRVRPKVVFDGSAVLGVERVDGWHSRLATTSSPGRHLSRHYNVDNSSIRFASDNVRFKYNSRSIIREG